MSEDPEETRTPRGELAIQTLAMPADTNQNGDIFGGWLLGQMDIGGLFYAAKVTRGRMVTVALDAMTFRRPVFVGDVVSIYGDFISKGTSSLCVYVEAWVIRRSEEKPILVTEGKFTYVNIDEKGKPTPIVMTDIKR